MGFVAKVQHLILSNNMSNGGTRTLIDNNTFVDSFDDRYYLFLIKLLTINNTDMDNIVIAC